MCGSLTSVKLNGAVEKIYPDALMRCESLEELVIPSTTVSLWSRCLFGCTSLKRLYIMNPTLQWVDAFVGRFLPALTDVYFAGTEEQWNAISIDRFNDMLLEANIHFSYEG